MSEIKTPSPPVTTANMGPALASVVNKMRAENGQPPIPEYPGNAPAPPKPSPTEAALARLAATPLTPVAGWAWRAYKDDKAGQLHAAPNRPSKEELEAYAKVAGYEHRRPSASDVCRVAKLDLAVGVVATVCASEFRLDHPIELLAGAHALINDARAVFTSDGGPTLAQALVLRACGGRRAPGFFGRQAGDGDARYCASFQPPNARTILAAELALAGVGAELAEGSNARRWIDLRDMDGGVQAGEKLHHNAETILRSRYEEGWKMLPACPGLDRWRLALLGRAGVSLAEALAVVAEGRTRKP
jgi:hypothetical protein